MGKHTRPQANSQHWAGTALATATHRATPPAPGKAARRKKDVIVWLWVKIGGHQTKAVAVGVPKDRASPSSMAAQVGHPFLSGEAIVFQHKMVILV